MPFHSKKKPLSLDEAEVIALKALAFLAEDPGRLTRFLELTGLSPAELRQNANSTQILSAVLEYLTGDESLLLVFAASNGLEPTDIVPAQELLTRPVQTRKR
jgi:hypothetical protein